MSNESVEPSAKLVRFLDTLFGPVEDLRPEELSSLLASAGIDDVAARARLCDQLKAAQLSESGDGAVVQSVASALVQLSSSGPSASRPEATKRGSALREFVESTLRRGEVAFAATSEGERQNPDDKAKDESALERGDKES